MSFPTPSPYRDPKEMAIASLYLLAPNWVCGLSMPMRHHPQCDRILVTKEDGSVVSIIRSGVEEYWVAFFSADGGLDYVEFSITFQDVLEVIETMPAINKIEVSFGGAPFIVLFDVQDPFLPQLRSVVQRKLRRQQRKRKKEVQESTGMTGDLSDIIAGYAGGLR